MLLHAAAVAAIVVGFGGSALAQETDLRRVLVYGDGLTWGWIPVAPITPTVRHPAEDRWTTALANALGHGHEVIAEGLSGRTTNIDDPTDSKLNGAAHLPATLASHEPLDLVVILLGTNDTKAYLDRTPLEIGLGAGELINIVHESPGWDWTDYPVPQVLLISPPPLGEEINPAAAEAFVGGREKSLELPQVYEGVAALAGALLRRGDHHRAQRRGRHPLHGADQRRLGRGRGSGGQAHPLRVSRRPRAA